MKLKNGYSICDVYGEQGLIPVLDEIGTYKEPMMNLTETEVFLCRMLFDECTYEELVKAVLDEFDAEKETVRGDVKEFTALLKKKRMLDGND